MDRETFESMIGEGFHTAFRKAVDSATAAQIHRLIGGMEYRDWAAVVSFVADGFPSEMFHPDPPPLPAGVVRVTGPDHPATHEQWP
jgi:hypothetical protein